MKESCLVFSGGVGGAKLALGMQACLPGPELMVVGNTGDDFEHLGLKISPDLDTLLYTLSGQVNPETGWGRRDETWQFLESLEILGGETWFRLGDRDLATHVYRSQALARGATLTEITLDMAKRFGVATQILPATNDRVSTVVETAAGDLDFQDYFVRQQSKPKVLGIEYRGANQARVSAQLLTVLNRAALDAIVIAPSNPWLSIDPMLAIPELSGALRANKTPVIAVSPIVHGAAIKGPTAKIMEELGLDVTALSVARHYQGLVDGFILDTADASLAPAVAELGMATEICNTVMTDIEHKQSLAETCLAFARRLSRP